MDTNENRNDPCSIGNEKPSTSRNETSKITGESFEVNSRPICMIVLGMAGSGKTSFVKRLTQLGNMQNIKPYVVNLDPACQEVPYHANIGKNKIYIGYIMWNKIKPFF